MLALRCAIYNGTFERVFAALQTESLQRHAETPRKNYVMHPISN